MPIKSVQKACKAESTIYTGCCQGPQASHREKWWKRWNRPSRGAAVEDGTCKRAIHHVRAFLEVWSTAQSVDKDS